jgi:hypothetical protein
MRQLGVLLMLPVALASQSPDDAPTNMQRFAAQSNFVFQGTVNRLNATTEPQMAASPSTAVVRVDRLIQGQDMVSDIVGKEITVQLLKPRSVTVGRPLMFFSNIAVMGKSVAVKEVAHFDVTRSSTMAGQVADYSKAKPERDLQRRVAAADVIVTGTVDTITPRAAAAEREGPEGSEHDPHWTAATITVQSTEKGAAQQRVTVWFPASDDIRWFRSPKLKPGQTGVFLLQRARERGLTTGYTVLDALDVQPAPQRDRVRQLINRPR